MSTARALDEWYVWIGRGREERESEVSLIPRRSVVLSFVRRGRRKVLASTRFPLAVHLRAPLSTLSNRSRSLCRRVARRTSCRCARRGGRGRRAAVVARRRRRGARLNSACGRDSPLLARHRRCRRRRRCSPGGERGSRRGRRTREGATSERVHVEGDTDGARGLSESSRNGSARGQKGGK